MFSPLLQSVIQRHGYRTISAEDHDDITAETDFACLFFSGDAARLAESDDVAVILPELEKIFEAVFTPFVVERDSERALGEEPPVIMGAISKEEIRKVVSDHKGAIRACYQEALKKDEELAGRIALTWTIGPSGKVTKVEVKANTTGSSELERCVVEEAKSWSFPALGGTQTITVTYPFEFRPPK